MKPLLLVVSVLVIAGGCQGVATRAWQGADMPSHDRQRVFDAAREVFVKHFEVAEASYTAGTITTKPQMVEGHRSGTLADLRGAGGRCRRIAYFEMDRDGLTVIARVAVRLEREGTAAAMAISEAASDVRENELPRTGPAFGKPRGRSGGEVWTEIGYDAGLSRELLSAIAERVRQAEQGEAMPPGQSPKDAAEETRRIGAKQGM